MKARLSALIGCAALVACVDTETTITGYARGGLPIGTFKTRHRFYGKGNIDSTLFGLTQQSNMDTGFKTLVQGLTALAGAIYYGKVEMAKQVTAQIQAQGVTQTQMAQINASLQESIATKGYEATLAGIKAGLFVPAGTVFTQPKL